MGLLGLARGGHLSVLLLFRLPCCQLTFFYSPYHSQEQPARMTSVFVGNIPYGVTEEQLMTSSARLAPSSLSGLCMTEKLDAQRDSASVSSKMWTLPDSHEVTEWLRNWRKDFESR